MHFGASPTNYTDGLSNTGCGYNALDGITSGDYNTALGANSGLSITGGSNNVSIGANSLDALSTGSRNTAVGRNSLTIASTSDDNVAVGYRSLYDMATNEKNTAIGSYSGENATGSSSVFIGYKAGFTQTTGTHLYIANDDDDGSKDSTWIYGDSDYNVDIPNGDLNVNNITTISNSVPIFKYTASNNMHFGSSVSSYTSGATNTSVGVSAQDALTSGSHNTTVGYLTGSAITSGDYNTLYGRSSGVKIVDGERNCSIGAYSLYENVSGDRNTCIGNNSGQNATGSASVFVGNFAGNSVTTGTHLYIGNADDSGTKAATWVYGDSSYNVEIPNGLFKCVGAYSNTVTSSRDVEIDSTGELGYVSSIRASKINIEPTKDISWFMRLKPIQFNYRKKVNKGGSPTYTDQAERELYYGLIAEDVELVNPAITFKTDGKLQGVSYKKLITPTIQFVQELQNKYDDLLDEFKIIKSQNKTLNIYIDILFKRLGMDKQNIIKKINKNE